MKNKNLSWFAALLVFALLLWCTAATPGKIADPSTYTCAVYSTLFSLLPPVIAIVLALNTKEVYTSLLVGIASGALLYANGNLELAINPDYPDNEAFAAITAEVAHSRFHAKGANSSYDRSECELDAQSISYILCRRYGIERPMPDMSNLAALYEGWEPQECRQALDNIQDTSKQFGRSIEKNLEMGKQRSRAPVHRPTR